jgi:hypothetical protein
LTRTKGYSRFRRTNEGLALASLVVGLIIGLLSFFSGLAIVRPI